VPNLVADLTKGTLILDGDKPPPPQEGANTTPKTADTCDDAEDSKRLRPISANDVRARGAGGC
jgi:hypothetical protein